MRTPSLSRRGLPGALALTAVAALGCSKPSPTPPTGFGVNITVDASKLSAAQRSMVKIGSLLVSGVESESKQFTVVPEISSGRLTFQYLPAVTSGTESFQFDAIDSAGLLYGTGTSGPVTLIANMAASVTIVLTSEPGTSKAVGAKCTAGTECGSGFCTDGTCCQEACKDTCASCALTKTLGICAPYPDGTDPENECAGSSMATGAGGAGGAAGAGGAGGAKTDAGAPRDAASDAEEITPPDGGIVAMPAVCGGKCDGMKGCASFKMQGTSCGTPFCNTRRDVASPICDGKGSCGIGLSDCTNGYACNSAAKPTPTCHTNCNANTDCTAGYYCNGTTSMCAPVKVDGLTCATDAECLHNHCVTGVCCNTACASPFTCNDSGSAGTCKCPGVTCSAGVSCAVFYPDVDGDGYGDKNASLGNTSNPAVPGCADTPPANHVADNTDCDDRDINVHPGQTAFFATASNGTKTFDYDCDGIMKKGVPEYPGGSCTFCPGCSACGPGASTCGSSGAQASFACPLEGGICLGGILSSETLLMSVVPAASTIVTTPPIIIKTACCGCDAADHAGFTTTVNCGASSNTYTTCGTCGSSGAGIGSSGGAANSSGAKVQTCR